MIRSAAESPFWRNTPPQAIVLTPIHSSRWLRPELVSDVGRSRSKAHPVETPLSARRLQASSEDAELIGRGA